MADAKNTPSHDLTRRVIRVAALLAERFENPDVAAYNRARGGARHRAVGFIVAPSSPRREQFWHSVGRALTAAYVGRGCPTDYERAVRHEINTARAAIAASTGVTA